MTSAYMLRFALLSSISLSVAPSHGFSQTLAPAPAPAYRSDPRFLASIAEGKNLTQTGQLVFAVDAYHKANKLSGGICADCLQDAIDLEFREHDFKTAGKDAAAMLAISTSAYDKSSANATRAEAMYRQAGDKPKPEQLQAVHDILQTSLADFPKNTSARFLDGTVLARMGQTDAARQQFSICVTQCPANDPYLVRAKHFVENPALSFAKMAPAFTVTALDGSKFTLDEMGGRVVLIDFWATWCGPCNEELPHMKKIAKDFAGQPLVIISISWDDDAAKWKAFIDKNQMAWLQYRDADHNLSKQFGVDAIPHYFTIDTDGVLTSELIGSENDVEGKLRKLLAKAKVAQPATTASIHPSSTSPTPN
jgi:peroxiredoxin